MAPGSSWQPVPGQSLDTELRRILEENSRLLADSPPAWKPPDVRLDNARAIDASLSGGWAGLALFFAYLDKVLDGQGYRDVSLGYLARAVAATPNTSDDVSLYNGSTGIAWAGTQIKDLHADLELVDLDQFSEEVDESLFELLDREGSDPDFDLIRGLVGFGVYALQRLPDENGVRLVERIVDRLEELAEPLDLGVTWWTPPELISPGQRNDYPDGYYNLGVAHGVPGILAFLARVYTAGIRTDLALQLLEGGMAWLLSQRRSGKQESHFGTWTAPGLGATDCRAAWCYGDPGVAASVLAAARAIGSQDWENEALETLEAVCSRDPTRCGVVDSGLCHGAMGLSHIFHRMYQATGRDFLHRASHDWLDRALSSRRRDAGIGGFPSSVILDDGGHEWVDDPGIVTGTTGVMLGLLAHVSSVEPNWDSMFLLDIRPTLP